MGKDAPPLVKPGTLVAHAEGCVSAWLDVVLEDGPTLNVLMELLFVEVVPVGLSFWEDPFLFDDEQLVRLLHPLPDFIFVNLCRFLLSLGFCLVGDRRSWRGQGVKINSNIA